MITLDSGLRCELVGLESSRLHDVLSSNLLSEEMIAQQSPVAFPEKLFRTHNSGPLISSSFKEIFNAVAKLLGQHMIGIVAKSDVLEGLIWRGFFTNGRPASPKGF